MGWVLGRVVAAVAVAVAVGEAVNGVRGENQGTVACE
mgnify:CR=1 FL=1